MAQSSVQSLAPRPLLLSILLAAFAWRLYGITHESLWRDEVDAIYFALRPLEETLSMFTAAAQNGPLYFLSLRPWFRLVSSSEFALRYPSVIFSILSIALLWQVCRMLFGAQATRDDELTTTAQQSLIRPTADLAPYTLTKGNNERGRTSSGPVTDATLRDASRDWLALVAALFLAVNPYQLWYAQEGKMYAVITCLALLSSWLWLRGISYGGVWTWGAYLLVTSLSMYTHLLMILIIPLHFTWFWLAWPQSKRHWQGYGLALAGLTLPYLPMAWWHAEMLTAEQKLSGFGFTPLQGMVRTLLLNHSRGFMPLGEVTQGLTWLSPLIFVGAAGLVMGILEIGEPQLRGVQLSKWRRFSMILSWLLLPILTIYLISLRQPVFTDRYIIWVAPAAAMILALGIGVVWRNGSIIGRPLAVLLVAYISGCWLYAGWQQTETTIKYDLRSAVHHIEAHRQPGELLILQIPHMEWSYRYYSGDRGTHPFDGSDERMGTWAGGLWTNNGLLDEEARIEVDTQMQSITDGLPTVWVLSSEVQMWDQRNLMNEWLNERGVIVDAADFHGAQVRKYELIR